MTAPRAQAGRHMMENITRVPLRLHSVPLSYLARAALSDPIFLTGRGNIAASFNLFPRHHHCCRLPSSTRGRALRDTDSVQAPAAQTPHVCAAGDKKPPACASPILRSTLSFDHPHSTPSSPSLFDSERWTQTSGVVAGKRRSCRTTSLLPGTRARATSARLVRQITKTESRLSSPANSNVRLHPID